MAKWNERKQICCALSPLLWLLYISTKEKRATNGIDVAKRHSQFPINSFQSWNIIQIKRFIVFLSFLLFYFYSIPFHSILITHYHSAHGLLSQIAKNEFYVVIIFFFSSSSTFSNEAGVRWPLVKLYVFTQINNPIEENDPTICIGIW